MAKRSSANADSWACVEKRNRRSGETWNGFSFNPKNENIRSYGVVAVREHALGGGRGREFTVVTIVDQTFEHIIPCPQKADFGEDSSMLVGCAYEYWQKCRSDKVALDRRFSSSIAQVCAEV